MTTERDEATAELIRFCTMQDAGGDSFTGSGPDWFGDRVFGGVVIAQTLDAAMRTTDRTVHSLHAYFLRPERPGPVEASVERMRDGRTFSTRGIVLRQNGKDLVRATCSFHDGDPGDEYQLSMPSVPPPAELVDEGYGPPPFEVREIGPSERAADGTYVSTRRVWTRSGTAPDDPRVHACLGAFLSDMTGSTFRPLSLGAWGEHADASIDHAVWFHRPFRADRWLYQDFQAVINLAGRSTVRGLLFDEDGNLCLSMAQELLIRPLS